MTHVDGGGVPAGTQLNGIYEIEKRLAIGGMGEVYIGRVIQTGDRVAIKMILPEHANNEMILDLFRKEASTLHNLYHEAIVRYYVFSVDPTLNRPYLSMEFASGPSLGDRLREAPLKEERMITLRERVAGGLYAAHKLGVIHRDISPDNIILVDGEVGKAKIIDFGIAKSTTSEGTLIGSGFAGKLKYVSPEQLGLFGGDVTGKSDIYSLGLVFAEAVTGEALPMGGSQVEVIEKRRSVPDLSQIPEWIRPLIESMVQPNPADRPADMQAVADWVPTGAAAKASRKSASAAQKPVHPRERRRQSDGEQDERRKSAPLLWIGIGGVGIAAAAAAAFLLVGDWGGTPGSGSTPGGAALAPDAGTLAPTAESRLAAPAASVVAPAGMAGASYSWTSAPFNYDGNPTDLVFSPDGTLPPGIALGDAADGGARLSGTPAEAGIYDFAVVAASPSGQTARMAVRLSVEKGGQIALAPPPATPTAPAGTLSAPTATDSGAPTLGGASGDSTATLAPAGSAPTLAPTSGSGNLPTVPSPDADPTAGSVEPSVATSVPDGLSAPASDSASGDLSSGGAGNAPTPGQTAVPTLSPAKGGGDLPTVPPVDKDPTAAASEPSVPMAVQDGLSVPSVEGSSTVSSQPGGEDLALPWTGPAQSQRPSSEGNLADSPVVASVPPPQNQPPTIESASAGPLSVPQGQPVNARLGTFFDEEGPSAMTLRIEGTVPNGLAIRLAEGGVAQLYGTPAEFGDYQIRVAAVDPEGLVSQPIPVSLTVAPPVENKAVRDYIISYNGGECFLSRPIELGPQLAQIEVFADQEKIQPVIDFDAAFKRDIGFEANIGMRPISDQQCPLIHALDQVGPQALDNSLVIDLDRDELTAGDELQGKIQGGQGASLFLYDHLGGLTDLTSYVETKNGETGFSVPVTARGPQILIAARPREDAGVTASAGLDALLGAAQRGQASLALGFFIMK